MSDLKKYIAARKKADKEFAEGKAACPMSPLRIFPWRLPCNIEQKEPPKVSPKRHITL